MIRTRYADIHGEHKDIETLCAHLCTVTTWWGEETEVPINSTIDNLFLHSCNRLGYYPTDYRCEVYVLNDIQAFNAVQFVMYGYTRYTAAHVFTSLSNTSVYLIANKAVRNDLRHAFGHLILHTALQQIKISPGAHEALAKFCEDDEKTI